MARMTLEEIRNRASTVDRAKVEATTEAEIEAHRAADGDADLDVTAGARVVESPRSLRVRLGMTQPEIAAALSIPLGTWRNWEQGRVSLEPAAVALLRIVSSNPALALAALSEREAEPAPPAEAPACRPTWRPEIRTVPSMPIVDQLIIDECVAKGWLVFEEVFMQHSGKIDPRVEKYRDAMTSLLEDPKVQDWLRERAVSREAARRG
ncbi:helix-turn-helix domain-containing protein [Methylobacterium fujisawaense]|uniref:helix-turn-helix domain-containing protein n=1 Tax=Methylobacterium fujisawaense TaxID=107400 RepID=UPI00313AA8CC